MRVLYWGLLVAAGAALGTAAHLALHPVSEQRAEALTASEPPAIAVYTPATTPPGASELEHPADAAPPASLSPAPQPFRAENRIEALSPGPRREARRPASGGTGSLSVLGRDGARTFVYLNGGKLLGEAPLVNTTVPAGRHTLLLWTPASRARTTRAVLVPPGGSITIRDEPEPGQNPAG